MARLSVLIPTQNRNGRLVRLLRFLASEAVTNPAKASILDQIEIIIANGSSGNNKEYMKEDIGALLAILNCYCKCRLLTAPGASLYSRLSLLAESASSDYVMMLGDDDFLIIDHIPELLDVIIGNRDVSIVVGRSVNIRSWDEAGLGYELLERPFSGFEISSRNIVARITQYYTLQALGTSTTGFGIQRKEFFRYYSRTLNNAPPILYYGGAELLHQVLCLIEGNVHISAQPLIVRDMTYIDYIADDHRNASDDNEYPYYGNIAIDLACESIVAAESTISDKDHAFQLLEYLFQFHKKLQPIKTSVVDQSVDNSMLVRSCLERIDRNSLAILYRVFTRTLSTCYARFSS